MTIIKFKNKDNNFFIEINTKTFNNIKNECIKAKNKETGGILIGTYSEDSTKASIITITGPPKDSKQTRNTFKRGSYGLIKLLDKKWKESQQYYIGEWHFHPNLCPDPSRVDDLQMKKLSKNKLLKCPEPILLIVGGNQNQGWKSSTHIYTKENRINLLFDKK